MSKTILIIEDNPDVLDNTAEILELANYKALKATNGKEGVELASQHKPDLIICDVMMPVMDGYEVIYLLHKNPETAGIPFIFLTAKSERQDQRKGMDMGADDYLTKPFDDMELMHAIEARLRKKELLDQNQHANLEAWPLLMDQARGFDELQKLSADRKARLYKRKDLIYHEGAYPSGIYFIQSGKVKTFKMNEDGKEYIVGLHGPGDFIGYLALLEERDYTETAEVLEDAELGFIPADDFSQLVHRNREVAQRFIKLLANSLAEREEQLLRLAYNSVRKRVAEALVLLHQRFNTQPSQPFSMPVAREDLANIVGTATESIIRTLSDFKEEGHIEIKGSQITIKSLDKLEKMRN